MTARFKSWLRRCTAMNLKSKIRGLLVSTTRIMVKSLNRDNKTWAPRMLSKSSMRKDRPNKQGRWNRHSNPHLVPHRRARLTISNSTFLAALIPRLSCSQDTQVTKWYRHITNLIRVWTWCYLLETPKLIQLETPISQPIRSQSVAKWPARLRPCFKCLHLRKYSNLFWCSQQAATVLRPSQPLSTRSEASNKICSKCQQDSKLKCCRHSRQPSRAERSVLGSRCQQRKKLDPQRIHRDTILIKCGNARTLRANSCLRIWQS